MAPHNGRNRGEVDSPPAATPWFDDESSDATWMTRKAPFHTSWYMRFTGFPHWHQRLPTGWRKAQYMSFWVSPTTSIAPELQYASISRHNPKAFPPDLFHVDVISQAAVKQACRWLRSTE
jgi:hypothetical protein